MPNQLSIFKRMSPPGGLWHTRSGGMAGLRGTSVERGLRQRFGVAFPCPLLVVGLVECGGPVASASVLDGGEPQRDAFAEGPGDSGVNPDGDSISASSDAASDDGADGHALDQEVPPDASPESGSPSEGGGSVRCLPDGSGSLTLRTSGALSLDVQLGNQDSCDGSWSLTGLSMTYFIPLGSDAGAKGILSVVVDGIAPGATVTGKPVSFSLLGGGIWVSPTPWPDGGVGPPACSVDITLDQRVGSSSSYKVAGTVHCGSAIPNSSPGEAALEVRQLDFVNAVGM